MSNIEMSEKNRKRFEWSMVEGKRNIYTCLKGHRIFTIQRCVGVTPFMISCPQCSETAMSAMHPVIANYCVPTHEWKHTINSDMLSLESINVDEYPRFKPRPTKAGVRKSSRRKKRPA